MLSTSPTYANLSVKVTTAFTGAVEASQISLFAPTTSSTTTEGYSPVQQLIHICPDLEDKPGAPPKTPDLVHQPDDDPFTASTTFGPGQLIEELDDHVLLNNENALLKNHFMMVRREFRAQAADLEATDLLAAFQVVQSFAIAGQDLLCFFNGGPLAGASQAHLHLQFCPFQAAGPPGTEALARSCPPNPHNLLTVPYLHYYSRLSLAPQDSLGETNASLAYLSNSLFNTYSKLLHQARSQFDLMDPALLPPAGAKRNSYNLLLTTEFMHFIPRTSQAVKIPVLKRDGEESNDETTEVVLNGLAYAGFWFVGTEKEKAEIEAYGLSRILAEAAYPREVTCDEEASERLPNRQVEGQQ